MKYIIAFCLLIQILHAAEFPHMNGYLSLKYNGVDLTKTFDGSWTASANDMVLDFTLCGDFGQKNLNGAVCDVDYDYWIKTPALEASAKGKYFSISENNFF